MPDERDYTLVVRVVAHGCTSADEAVRVLRSFFDETARSAQRHELSIDLVDEEGGAE